MQWYERAAEQGIVDAQCAVGTFYVEGHVVETDLSQARKWFQRAAQSGSEQAIAFLAKMDELGQ
jgi:TPR repeat protein